MKEILLLSSIYVHYFQMHQITCIIMLETPRWNGDRASPKVPLGLLHVAKTILQHKPFLVNKSSSILISFLERVCLLLVMAWVHWNRNCSDHTSKGNVHRVCKFVNSSLKGLPLQNLHTSQLGMKYLPKPQLNIKQFSKGHLLQSANNLRVVLYWTKQKTERHVWRLQKYYKWVSTTKIILN